MDELIQEMQSKNLIQFKLIGKSRAVFGLINLFATTQPMETDPGWWAIRAYCLGMSLDKQLPGELRFRRN
jgi:hypothetical protein